MTVFAEPYRQSGFTLIEIMVVVIIIGVISVALVSSLNSNHDRKARLQANRFMAVVNEVRDEAVISGDHIALIVNEDSRSYRFESARGLENTVQDTLLRNRVLDENVGLDWTVIDVIDTDDQSEPQALITPLGEITSFEARFIGTELSYVVLINQQGQLETIEKKGVNF